MKRRKKSVLLIAIATVVLFLYLQPAEDNSANRVEDTKREILDDPNMVLERSRDSGHSQEDLLPSKEDYNLELMKELNAQPEKPELNKIDLNQKVLAPMEDDKDPKHQDAELSKEFIKIPKATISRNQFPQDLDVRREDDAKKFHITVKRRLKVYIYKLPERFNIDIYNCVSPEDLDSGKCYRMWEKGLGVFLYKRGEFSVHNTHQFSLEVVLHNQLLHSKYVTNNPEEADLFYIPAYFGIQYYCSTMRHDIRRFSERMFDVVKSMPYFGQGKPHLSALAKIEKELAMDMYPLLQNKNYRNVTCIVIEKLALEYYRNGLGLENQRVIVAPYPSYVHLDPRLAVEQTIASPTLTSRKVFMFIASSDRRTNPFRNSIIDQFPSKVSDLSFQSYMKLEVGSSQDLQIWLVTQECVGQQENFTIDWMQNSVFCLQPHGDSPTRKSFYDSILSGCIPVIFKFNIEKVEYPFERVLNYSDFVVTIDAQRIQTNKEKVVDILKSIPISEVQRLYNNILLVARQLQYSVLDKQGTGYADLPFVDALDMIVEEARYMYGL